MRKLCKKEENMTENFYKEFDIPRMQKGLAPQRFNFEKGLWESKHLHHTPIQQKDGGLFQFIDLWPDEHIKLHLYSR